MRINLTHWPSIPAAQQFVSAPDHQIAWTPDQAGQVPLAATGVCTVGGVTLLTAPLEPSTLTRMCETIAPYFKTGPDDPRHGGVDVLEVVMAGSDALDAWKDGGVTKGQRLFRSVKLAAKAEEVVVNCLKPHFPALAHLEAFNGCLSIFVQVGEDILTAELKQPRLR